MPCFKTFREIHPWTIECKLYLTPNIVCKGMLLLTVPHCTEGILCFSDGYVGTKICGRIVTTLILFPFFYEDTSTSFIDKAKGRLKRFFFMTFYPRFYNSILAFHCSILDFYNSILAFYNSILAFLNSMLGFYNSILAFYYSILDFYNSIFACYNSILAFYNSPLDFYNPILDFYNSKLTFLNSKLDTVKKNSSILHVFVLIFLVSTFCRAECTRKKSGKKPTSVWFDRMTRSNKNQKWEPLRAMKTLIRREVGDTR